MRSNGRAPGCRGTLATRVGPGRSCAMARASIAALVLALVLALARVAASQPTTVLRRDPSTGDVLANPHFETSDGVVPVVAFYHAWYGNPANDGAYRRWDHAVLPHWDPKVNARVFGADAAEALGANPSSRALGSHRPPDDIHAPFYPSRGCYSSLDPRVLDAHMREALASGVNTFAVSWLGRPDVVGTADPQGVNTDAALQLVVAAAERTCRASAADANAEFPGGMRVAFHLEPYPGRTAASVREDIRHILDRHGDSPALLRGAAGAARCFSCTTVTACRPAIGPPSSPRPVTTPSAARTWTEYFSPCGSPARTARRSRRADSTEDTRTLPTRERRTPRIRNIWRVLSDEAAARSLLFVPSVSPGYNDTRIRPWNVATTRGRRGGRTYAANWRAALAVKPAAIGITSWNEWGEGTQIEPAEVGRGGTRRTDSWRTRERESRDGAPRCGGTGTAEAAPGRDGDGSSDRGGDPNLYLDLTRAFARGMRRPGFDEGGAGFVRDEL